MLYLHGGPQMTVEQTIVEQLHTLSTEDQEKVLQYMRSLHSSGLVGESVPLHLLDPGCSALAVDDIEERWLRDWEHFPRDYPRGDGL
jgi:hypothetical protein